MRILFTVQGEGRGHLTQATAMWELLSRSGHELVGVVAGTHPARQLPRFFLEAFPVPVTSIRSAGFVFSAGRGVDLPATLWHALLSFQTWRDSLRRLRRLIAESRPDLIINFFEPLIGVMQLLRPLPVPVIAVAHQYHLLHQDSVRLSTRRLEQWWLRLFIRLVGYRSWKLALSFTPRTDYPERRWFTSPPLLRQQVRSLQPTAGEYVLVYLLNHGYAEQIREWHSRHPEVELHCFYDRPGAPPVEQVDDSLTFHAIHPESFLELMAGCRAVVTTAGFESVCEAAFLGKPVVMVPVEHHLEQMLNAEDGERTGLGIALSGFDLDVLEALPAADDAAWFRHWCLQAEPRLNRALRTIMAGGSAGRTPPYGRDLTPHETELPDPIR